MKVSVVRHLLGYLKKHIPAIIVSAILALVTVVVTLLIPVLIGKAVDAIVEKDRVIFDEVYKDVLFIVLLIAAAFLAQWLMTCLNNRIVFHVARSVRDDVYESINRLSISRIDSFKTGDLVSRMIADVEQISDGLILGFSQLFTGLFTIGTTLVFMLFIDVKVALVVVLVTPLSMFAAAFIAKRSHRYFGDQSKNRGEMTAYVNEMTAGQKTVRAYRGEDEMLRKFADGNEKLFRASKNAMFYSSLVNPVTRFVNAIVYMLVGLIGALSAIGGVISVGNLFSLLAYANQYTKPFNEISGVITELTNAFVCAKRVFEVLEMEDEADAWGADPEGEIESIRFEHVNFSYDGKRDILHDVSFEIKRGQRVAVVGQTGGGKTTLISLLMRYYEPEGVLVKFSNSRYPATRFCPQNAECVVVEQNCRNPRVLGVHGDGKDERCTDSNDESSRNPRVLGVHGDGKGEGCTDSNSESSRELRVLGVHGDGKGEEYDIRELDIKKWRRRFAMVLQDTWIKAGTIAENIAFGNENATIEMIRDAAHTVGADVFIDQLEDGYDTYLTENGDGLSEGQKQLIELARVVLGKPEILVLDEATSNVDTLTEKKINEAFDKLMEGRTSFVVAHRLSTIKNADVILTVDKGRIVRRQINE